MTHSPSLKYTLDLLVSKIIDSGKTLEEAKVEAIDLIRKQFAPLIEETRSAGTSSSRLSRAAVADMKRRYAEGEKVAAIASIYKVTPQAVYNHVSRHMKRTPRRDGLDTPVAAEPTPRVPASCECGRGDGCDTGGV
jgi:ATP phosphoribosyltransferase